MKNIFCLFERPFKIQERGERERGPLAPSRRAFLFFFARRLSRCAQLTERLEEATFIGTPWFHYHSLDVYYSVISGHFQQEPQSFLFVDTLMRVLQECKSRPTLNITKENLPETDICLKFCHNKNSFSSDLCEAYSRTGKFQRCS